jgi:hypothetical protein
VRQHATISVTLSRPAAVRLALFNSNGQLLREIDCGEKPSGTSGITMDTSDLLPGTYFLRILTPHGHDSRLFIVL